MATVVHFRLLMQLGPLQVVKAALVHMISATAIGLCKVMRSNHTCETSEIIVSYANQMSELVDAA